MAKHFFKTLFIFLLMVVLGILGVYFALSMEEGQTLNDFFEQKN